MINKDDINNYFELINKKLEERGASGSIVMAGGASLCLIHDARESTKDIDAIFEPSPVFRDIIREIAQEQHIDEDWMNDGVKGFMTSKMRQNLYKEYSNLSVYSVDDEGLLAMKLTSARPDSHDISDSLTLMKSLDIKNENQVFDIVETYANPNQLTAKSHFFIQEAYGMYAADKEKDIQKSDKTDHDHHTPGGTGGSGPVETAIKTTNTAEKSSPNTLKAVADKARSALDTLKESTAQLSTKLDKVISVFENTKQEIAKSAEQIRSARKSMER